MLTPVQQKESIRHYYENILQSSQDLKTNACCTADNLPNYIRSILTELDSEILEKFYGCGSPIPLALNGMRVLDLGCGSGRDCYALSKLVGDKGSVIGVDMSPEQLAVAAKHLVSQTRKFGFATPNIEFKLGHIEDLEGLGIQDSSQDLVISNCVINLSPDKLSVFREIFRVLKKGGELYFADVFADRRIPESLRHDPVLLGECLAGAMYLEDFRRLLRELGCLDYRIVNCRKIAIGNPDIEKKIGMVNFYSITIRAFKLEGLEDICEDYGQVATYKGTIAESPHHYILDNHHTFEARKPLRVCSNTAFMLANTRLAEHFEIQGDLSTHFGAFAGCGHTALTNTSTAQPIGSCC